nr:hypothetical protein [Gammaproteobacteria bacterium]
MPTSTDTFAWNSSSWVTRPGKGQILSGGPPQLHQPNHRLSEPGFGDRQIGKHRFLGHLGGKGVFQGLGGLVHLPVDELAVYAVGRGRRECADRLCTRPALKDQRGALLAFQAVRGAARGGLILTGNGLGYAV